VTTSSKRQRDKPSSSAQSGLIWEAKRGQQTVTLVGTMHVGVQPDQIPGWLWARLEAADTLVTEVDLAAMNGRLIHQYLLLEQADSLERMLGKDD